MIHYYYIHILVINFFVIIFEQIFGEIGAKELYSYDGESSKEFTDKFISISRAAMSFPLNIPGTTYYKCLKVIN